MGRRRWGSLLGDCRLHGSTTVSLIIKLLNALNAALMAVRLDTIKVVSTHIKTIF